MRKIVLLLASSALAMLLAALPVERAEAAFPGQNGKIIFDHEYLNYETGEERTQLHIMNSDGSGLMRLPRQPNNNHNYEAVWSPDGNKLAFVSAPRGGKFSIYVMEADGSKLRKLTEDEASVGTPAWSPDGTKIAFASYRDGNWEIYAMDSDGSNQTNLTKDPAQQDYHPAWASTPNGEKIAFGKGNSEIYVMDSDGSNQTNLVPHLDDPSAPRYPYAYAPAWSPDGTKLAYSYSEFVDGYRDTEIRCISLTNEECTASVQTSHHDVLPVWSPDGTKLLSVTADFGDASGILMTDLRSTGSEPRYLSFLGSNPDWQPLTAATHPGTLLDSGPSGTVNETSATFTFSAVLGEGTTFECSLDGAAFEGCTSPKSYENLKAGEHTFRVRSVGTNGVADPTPAVRTWSVKPTDTTIDSGPSGYVSEKSATFTFSSSRTPATFRCSFDGSVFRSCTSPKSYADLRDGRHTFRVKATDQAGNVDPTPAVRSWIVDTTAPLITDMRPVPGSTTEDRTPTISATVRDAQLDLAKENIKLFVDGRQVLAFNYNRDTNRLTYTPDSNLSYDKHTVRVRAKDAVDLVASKWWSFKIIR